MRTALLYGSVVVSFRIVNGGRTGAAGGDEGFNPRPPLVQRVRYFLLLMIPVAFPLSV